MLAFHRLIASHYLLRPTKGAEPIRWLIRLRGIILAALVSFLIELSWQLGSVGGLVVSLQHNWWQALIVGTPLTIEILSLNWTRVIKGQRIPKIVLIVMLGLAQLCFYAVQLILHFLPPSILTPLRIQVLPAIQVAALIAGIGYVLVKIFVVMLKRMSIFTTISVYGLFLGTGALVIVLSVMSGFEQDLKRKILGTNAHIVVTSREAAFTDYAAVRDRVAKVPGVIGASPYLEAEVMIASQLNLAGVIVKGIDPATVGAVTDLPKTMDVGGLEYLADPNKLKTLGGPPILSDDPKDPPTNSNDPKPKDADTLAPRDDADKQHLLDDSLPPRPVRPGVIIGRELAKNLRLYPGDDCKIVSPFGGIGPSGAIPKSKPFRVAGIFFSGMYEYDTKYAYLALPAAQKFFDEEGQATGIEAKVVNPDETEPVVARIQSALGDKYEVHDWKDLNRSLFSALKIEKILMFVLLCFIILVAAFSIIANGTMLVMEKGREIAILKAMGASNGDVLGAFMLLGLIIGGLGTVVGLITGVCGCFALHRFGLPLNPDVYYITTLPVNMNGAEIALVPVAALAIALAATLYPAWMAARLRPVEALRDA